MKPSRRKTRFNKHRTERFPSEWPPPPFASWKDPGIKIASVKVLRFTIVTTRQLLDGLQSQTWKSWLLLKEYGYCWRIPVQKYKYSHRGIQLRHGGIDHCWMTHFVPRLNSKVCWTLWPVQWQNVVAIIWSLDAVTRLSIIHLDIFYHLMRCGVHPPAFHTGHLRSLSHHCC